MSTEAEIFVCAFTSSFTTYYKMPAGYFEETNMTPLGCLHVGRIYFLRVVIG